MDEQEARQVFSMSQDRGWDIVRLFIDENVESIKNQLVNRNFGDLGEVRALQMQLEAFNKVLAFVEKREQKIIGGDN